MKYENGFYAYTPNKETEEDMHELSIPQIIEIIESNVWLTGCVHEFDIDYITAIGRIGKMVMNQKGELK